MQRYNIYSNNANNSAANNPIRDIWKVFYDEWKGFFEIMIVKQRTVRKWL